VNFVDVDVLWLAHRKDDDAGERISWNGLFLDGIHAAVDVWIGDRLRQLSCDCPE
jgi:hypothetical protein